MDDKIIYALNTSIPTESFKGQLDPVVKCKELNTGLQNAYDERQKAIKTCIFQSAEVVKELKTEREKNEGDVQLNKKFKAEQRKVENWVIFGRRFFLIRKMHFFFLVAAVPTRTEY